ncbi:MAG: hypothetical protein M5U26_11735 [Planctomycetota bacterium]|nr:hypothetical protein [Planctomycetota bacterium]
MTLPRKSVMVRLSDEMAEKFGALCREFGGLPPATVLRMLVADALEVSLDDQVEHVTRQIRKGSQSEERAIPSPRYPRPSANTGKRRAPG